MSGLITVRGDVRQGVVPADPGRRVGELLVDWAAHYSSAPPADLVVVDGATSTMVDPAKTLGELRLGQTAVLRLLDVDQAAAVTGALRVGVPAPPAPRPAMSAGAETALAAPAGPVEGPVRRLVSLRTAAGSARRGLRTSPAPGQLPGR